MDGRTTFGHFLFNPAKRHMDEEKQRLQSTREEVGDASGGKRIDLDSGKVVIRRKAKAVKADLKEPNVGSQNPLRPPDLLQQPTTPPVTTPPVAKAKVKAAAKKTK